MALTELLDKILADPVAVLHGTSQAAESLIASGPQAIDAIAGVLRGGPKAKANAIDVFEALGLVLGRLAVAHRSRVNDLLSDTTISGNLPVVQWALDYADQSRGSPPLNSQL